MLPARMNLLPPHAGLVASMEMNRTLRYPPHSDGTRAWINRPRSVDSADDRESIAGADESPICRTPVTSGLPEAASSGTPFVQTAPRKGNSPSAARVCDRSVKTTNQTLRSERAGRMSERYPRQFVC